MRGPALAALAAMCAAVPLPAQVSNTTREELPRLLTAAAFVYPESLANARVHGLVLIRALIDSSGHAMVVGSGVAATSDHRLDSLAVSYVRGLTFKPGRRNGAPTPAALVIPVEFPPVPLEGRVYAAWETDSAPELLDNPIVQYPRVAERNRLGGTVEVMAVVSPAGRVEPALLHITQSSDSVFDRPALALVRGMVYRPALREGHAVRCVLIVPVSFRPSDASAVPTRASGRTAPTPGLPFDEAPVLVAPPKITYPDTLRALGMQGRVVVRAVVDTAGRIDPGSAVIFMTTDSAFDQPALAAAVGAVFRPARARGSPVPALVDVPIDFILSPLDTAGAVSITAVQEKPELLRHPPVTYPPGMFLRGVVGRVVVQAIIDTSGHVEPGSVQVLESPHPVLSRSARNVVLNSEYRPGRVNGKAVRVLVQIPIDFRIAR